MRYKLAITKLLDNEMWLVFFDLDETLICDERTKRREMLSENQIKNLDQNTTGTMQGYLKLEEGPINASTICNPLYRIEHAIFFERLAKAQQKYPENVCLYFLTSGSYYKQSVHMVMNQFFSMHLDTSAFLYGANFINQEMLQDIFLKGQILDSENSYFAKANAMDYWIDMYAMKHDAGHLNTSPAKTYLIDNDYLNRAEAENRGIKTIDPTAEDYPQELQVLASLIDGYV